MGGDGCVYLIATSCSQIDYNDFKSKDVNV